jgi:hypothetical protein
MEMFGDGGLGVPSGSDAACQPAERTAAMQVAAFQANSFKNLSKRQDNRFHLPLVGILADDPDSADDANSEQGKARSVLGNRTRANRQYNSAPGRGPLTTLLPLRTEPEGVHSSWTKGGTAILIQALGADHPHRPEPEDLTPLLRDSLTREDRTAWGRLWLTGQTALQSALKRLREGAPTESLPPGQLPCTNLALRKIAAQKGLTDCSPEPKDGA